MKSRQAHVHTHTCYGAFRILTKSQTKQSRSVEERLVLYPRHCEASCVLLWSTLMLDNMPKACGLWLQSPELTSFQLSLQFCSPVRVITDVIQHNVALLNVFQRLSWVVCGVSSVPYRALACLMGALQRWVGEWHWKVPKSYSFDGISLGN